VLLWDEHDVASLGDNCDDFYNQRLLALVLVTVLGAVILRRKTSKYNVLIIQPKRYTISITQFWSNLKGGI